MVVVAFAMGFCCCILGFCGLAALGKDVMRWEQQDKAERNRKTYE